MTEATLTRNLPSRFVLAVVVGGIIGLGILRGPGEIAEIIPDPFLYLALWLLVGLFVLLTTAVTAELVGMTQRSGGTYSLIRRAFGPYPGFVIGWLRLGGGGLGGLGLLLGVTASMMIVAKRQPIELLKDR